MGRFAWHEEELGLTVCCIHTRVYPVWKTSLIKHCHFLTHIPCLLKDGVVRVRYTSGQIAVTKWLTDKQADSEADRSMHKYTKAWGKTALTCSRFFYYLHIIQPNSAQSLFVPPFLDYLSLPPPCLCSGCYTICRREMRDGFAFVFKEIKNNSNKQGQDAVMERRQGDREMGHKDQEKRISWECREGTEHVHYTMWGAWRWVMAGCHGNDAMGCNGCYDSCN